jgi:carboxymethylenebutenolidase
MRRALSLRGSVLIHRLAPLAALLALACGPPAAPPSDAGAASAVPGPASSPSAAPPAASPHTGILSEEAFKALHQLTAEKAPPPKGHTIQIDGVRAYLSVPAGAKPPLPGVIVIHEWWGLNEHIMHWTDRLAEDGYAALAVDLYGGKVARTPDEAMAAMKAVDEAAALKVVRAAHRFLETDPRVQAPRTASIGWCFGGAWSLQLALNEPALDAAVIYYGRLVTDPKKLEAIRAPLLGVFGNKDEGIPPKAVDEFDRALHDAGVVHTILRYDAQHAFANPSGARYDQKAAEEAWRHVRGFLAARLKGEEGGAAP